MALIADVTLQGGVTVPDAYRKLVAVQWNHIERKADLTFLDFRDEAERRRQGGANFGQTVVKLPPRSEPEKIQEGLKDPQGNPVRVLLSPAVESATDLANKPLSTWMAVPEDVATPQQLLDHLTYASVEAAFAYGVAKKRPEFAGATDI